MVCTCILEIQTREAIPRNQNLNRTNCTFNRLLQASQTIVRGGSVGEGNWDWVWVGDWVWGSGFMG